MSYVLSVVGPEKSGKTDWMLSAPKPMFYQELDIGGFDRAVWRHPEINVVRVKDPKMIWPVDSTGIQIDYAKLTSSTVVLRQYKAPMQGDSAAMNLMKVLIKKHGTGGLLAKSAPSLTLTGYIKQWYEEFIPDYISALENPAIRSIAWDTGGSVWVLCHKTLLEEKQKRASTQGDSMRESLIQIEYSDANERMRAMIQLAREHDKNLIVAHHDRDRYETKKNERGHTESYTVGREAEGWSHFNKNVDLEIWTSVRPMNLAQRNNGEHNAPSQRISLSGLTMDAVGLDIKDGNWDTIFSIIEGQRSLAIQNRVDSSPVTE